MRQVSIKYKHLGGMNTSPNMICIMFGDVDNILKTRLGR